MYRYDELQARACLQPDIRGFGARGAFPRKKCLQPDCGALALGAFPGKECLQSDIRGFGAGAHSHCAVSLQPDCGPLAQGRLPRVAKEGYFDRLYILSKYPSGNLSLFYSILS